MPTTSTTKSWIKDGFRISTDASLISIDELITIFNSDAFYWAKALPRDDMKEMLANSLCFGMHKIVLDDTTEKITSQETDELVGFARCVTDFTTFIYLTDVWVKPTLQGRGLGRWMISCIKEIVVSLPHLRRAMLLTGNWDRSVPFYEECLDMSLITSSHGNGLAVMECKGKGHPSYGRVGSTYTQ